MNIELVIASGRPLYSIKNLFNKYIHKLIIIGDNGASIWAKGKDINASKISTTKISEIVAFSQNYTDSIIVFSGINKTFIFKSDKKSPMLSGELLGRIQTIENINEINDEIVKISMHFPEANAKSYYDDIIFLDLKNKFSVTLSDVSWIDVMNININKAVALTEISEQLNIEMNQIMVFGNALNDKEMLKAVEHSYIVDNAHPEMSEFANYKTASNEELGVFKIIEKLIKLKAYK